MNDEKQPSRSRIQRLSRWAGAGALAGCILIAASVVLAAFDAGTLDQLIRTELLGPDRTISIAPRLRAICYGLLSWTVIFYVYGLLTARRLFLGYAGGDVFSESAGRRLARIGWSVAALPIATNISITIAALLATWDAGPGQRILKFSFSGADFLALVYGVLLIVVGYVLTEAARLSEENRQFV